MDISLRANFRNSIATKLLTIVFSMYFLVALSVTVAHIVNEYTEAKKVILMELQGYSDAYSLGLIQALWSLDEAQIQSILAGMMKISSITGVQLQEDFEKIRYTAGEIPEFDQIKKREAVESFSFFENQPLSLHTDLVYAGNDINEPILIGKVTIYSNSSIIFQRVKIGILFITLNSVIKTVALWIIFYWVAKYMLRKPLAILTNGAERVALDQLNDLQIKTNVSGKNELTILEDAFNQMIQKIRLEKDRIISLGSSSHKIASFHNMSDIMLTSFNELCQWVNIHDAVLHLDIGQHGLEKANLYYSRSDFLKTIPTQSIIEEVFAGGDQQVVLCNDLQETHPLSQYYRQQSGEELTNHHMIFARVDFQNSHLLILYRKSNQPPFNRADAEYINSMLVEAKTSLDNLIAIKKNMRMASELKTAATVQSTFFPKILPVTENLAIHAYFQSATETGGDWYGFMTKFDNYLYIFIGDVTGHGIPSALVTAAVSSSSQMLEEIFYSDYLPHYNLPTPAQCMEYLNIAVYETGHPNYLMTFFISRIDLKTGEMYFSNAGHNFPLLIHQNSSIQLLKGRNNRLGYQREEQFSESKIMLEVGDTLLFYTDGLIENENPQGEMWGMRNLKTKLKNVHSDPIEKVVKEIVDEAEEFYANTPVEDDYTVVGCQVTGHFQQK